MARSTDTYVCQDCGTEHRRWAGKCDGCGAWNTIIAEKKADTVTPKFSTKGARAIEFVSLDGESKDSPRFKTGIAEFDRVLGGGVVPGSAVLVGGDPGIGKSTLLTQAMAMLAKQAASRGEEVVYISGEEAVAQVRLRAARLNLSDAPVKLASESSLKDILISLDNGKPPAAVVIDSIQTMYADSLDSAPGTVSQVRACAAELVRFAKKKGSALILVGHVTKDGQIAGPRVVEHMVDTVLYFEGERGHQFRILRAVKNRFGATDEIGVFEMSDAGLSEVPNPSALFLGNRDETVSGASVFAGMEGTRPVLLEIQALVANSALGTPRRAVVGWDSSRLNMVLAVLEARCGVSFAGQDVYLNVAGGLKITEPAADLAVVAALLSAASGEPVPPHTVLFGEVSLSGEVRPVGQSEARLKEAAKLGFKQAVCAKGVKNTPSSMQIAEIDRVLTLVNRLDKDDRAIGTIAAKAATGKGA